MPALLGPQLDDGVILEQRPSEIIDLFAGGGAYSGWEAFNWKRRRFYVLNAKQAIGALRAEPTLADGFMKKAQELIQTTSWPEQYRGEYTASKVQLYPHQLAKPKLFEKAAVVVVALELMRDEFDPSYDVYRYVKIAPAFYFLDEFDRERLRFLTAAFSSLDPSQRRSLRDNLGLPVSAEADFTEMCQAAAKQSPRSTLLREMTDGYCVTRQVTEDIANFVMKAFNDSVSIGPCRQAGEPESFRPDLGVKDAAPSLLPPVYSP